MNSLTRQLARRIKSKPVTPSDLAAAERFVRDWLGSYGAGSAAHDGQLLRRASDGAKGLESQVFLAAALSHVTETDDLHRASVTHPGCVVVPVALIFGRKLGLTGHAALRAVLAGYEAMTRVGEALGPAHYKVFHNTATAGVFGSAAAAATLLGLDEDQWVWAFGNAGTQAAGLWQFLDDSAMSKPLHAGHAAEAGLRAALLAKEGFTGADHILEGPKGFFRALCPDARPEMVLAETEGWKLPETSMKPYPCCRHVHAVIDAAMEVRTRTGGELPAHVRVESYPAALALNDRPEPRTTHEAHFSMQHAAAVTLARGLPGILAFEAEAIADPTVQAIRTRTSVAVGEDIARAYPAKWGAMVEVESVDGSRVRALREGARGDPDAPLNDEELDAKTLGLLVWGGMDEGKATKLLRRTRKLTDDGKLFSLPHGQRA